MSSNSSGCGTQDWMPPELLAALEENKQYPCSKETDIFSMGLTMYYVMSGGEHPGGVPSRRTINIAKGNLSFDAWSRNYPSVCIRFQSCISKMICKDRKDRVKIQHVLKHPWCWKPARNLKFIVDVSNYLSAKGDEVGQDRINLKNLISERIPCIRIGTNGWKGILCDKVRSYLVEYATARKNAKNYDEMDFTKLLEFIRDKEQHFSELPDNLKSDDVFGKDKETYVKYFTQKFPALIPLIYIFLQCRRKNRALSQYYHEGSPFTFD
jgi:serine/threonine-protein kinase/endoribonuclease IRE1